MDDIFFIIPLMAAVAASSIGMILGVLQQWRLRALKKSLAKVEEESDNFSEKYQQVEEQTKGIRSELDKLKEDLFMMAYGGVELTIKADLNTTQRAALASELMTVIGKYVTDAHTVGGDDETRV